MKEIGMEKLLELLNEHRIELAHGNLQNHLMRHYNGYVFGLGDLNSQNCVLLIISKEYGFIKWLVENDKIDLGEKLFNLTKNDNRKSIICDLDNNDFSWEDTFLMLLSISDTPIEDLVSYLK